MRPCTEPNRKFIKEHFRDRVGRFIELGAYDGRTDSLTIDLVDAGWEGVMVEANPSCFQKLLYNHSRNPKIRLINGAIVANGGLRAFHDDGGFQESTLSHQHRDNPHDRRPEGYTSYTINAFTPQELIRFLGGPRNWDFLMIDLEGISVPVFKAFPLQDMRETGLVCVEWDAGGVAEVHAAVPELYQPFNVVHPNVFLRRVDDVQS